MVALTRRALLLALGAVAMPTAVYAAPRQKAPRPVVTPPVLTIIHED